MPLDVALDGSNEWTIEGNTDLSDVQAIGFKFVPIDKERCTVWLDGLTPM